MSKSFYTNLFLLTMKMLHFIPFNQQSKINNLKSIINNLHPTSKLFRIWFYFQLALDLRGFITLKMYLCARFRNLLEMH